MAQDKVKRVDVEDGIYIPTTPIANKIWSTDGVGDADWRDNPALVSPLTTKGDMLVYSTQDVRLPVGPNGYRMEADSTTPEGVKWAYPLNLQKEVTTSTYTVLATDDRYTIFFNSASAITVTIDDVAQDNLEVDFYNLGAGDVTFVAGTATLGTPDGAVLEQDKVCALIKFMANNNYKLKGELV